MSLDTQLPAPELQDDWVNAAESKLASAVGRVRELRQVKGLPDPRLGMGEVLAVLADLRVRLDEVESIQSDVSQFRTSLRVLLKESSHRVEDKWNEQVVGIRTGAKRQSFGEYGSEAPRERYARADVAVLSDRIRERSRIRAFDATTDAYDTIDRIRRGLDGVRMDLHALLRAISVPEHRFDRTDSA